MISIDDFFELDGALIAKSQLQGVSQITEREKNKFSFSVLYLDGKQKQIGIWDSKKIAEEKRTEWIQKNLRRKPEPVRVCTGCGMVQE